MQIVIARPGEIARAVDHPRRVTFDHIRALVQEGRTHDVFVGTFLLGTIPAGVTVRAWVDDEGLLNDATPNRVMPNGTMLCGTLVITGEVDGESVAMSDADASWLVRDINARWTAVDADAAKPKPEYKVTVLDPDLPFEEQVRNLLGGGR